MSLDDRDYYREHIRRLQGFGPNPWEREARKAAKRLAKTYAPDEARFAPGMSQAEVDALLKRRVSLCRWAVILLLATCSIWAGAIWMITSGATVQQLMGFVTSHITAQAPKPLHPPMPRVIY